MRGFGTLRLPQIVRFGHGHGLDGATWLWQLWRPCLFSPSPVHFQSAEAPSVALLIFLGGRHSRYGLSLRHLLRFSVVLLLANSLSVVLWRGAFRGGSSLGLSRQNEWRRRRLLLFALLISRYVAVYEIIPKLS